MTFLPISSVERLRKEVLQLKPTPPQSMTARQLSITATVPFR